MIMGAKIGMLIVETIAKIRRAFLYRAALAATAHKPQRFVLAAMHLAPIGDLADVEAVFEEIGE
jgi:hypothetical protein